MDRRTFLRASCLGCSGLALGSGLLSLSGCAAIPLVKTESDGRSFTLPLSAFGEGTRLIARTRDLPYDVLVMKLPTGDLRALYLQCTHRDQPLSATNTDLHCTSHGSRFAMDGSVVEGPASKPLRIFPVQLVGEQLHIQFKN